MRNGKAFLHAGFKEAQASNDYAFDLLEIFTEEGNPSAIHVGVRFMTAGITGPTRQRRPQLRPMNYLAYQVLRTLSARVVFLEIM